MTKKKGELKGKPDVVPTDSKDNVLSGNADTPGAGGISGVPIDGQTPSSVTNQPGHSVPSDVLQSVTPVSVALVDSSGAPISNVGSRSGVPSDSRASVPEFTAGDSSFSSTGFADHGSDEKWPLIAEFEWRRIELKSVSGYQKPVLVGNRSFIAANEWLSVGSFFTDFDDRIKALNLSPTFPPSILPFLYTLTVPGFLPSSCAASESVSPLFSTVGNLCVNENARRGIDKVKIEKALAFCPTALTDPFGALAILPQEPCYITCIASFQVVQNAIKSYSVYRSTYVSQSFILAVLNAVRSHTFTSLSPDLSIANDGSNRSVGFRGIDRYILSRPAGVARSGHPYQYSAMDAIMRVYPDILNGLFSESKSLCTFVFSPNRGVKAGTIHKTRGHTTEWSPLLACSADAGASFISRLISMVGLANGCVMINPSYASAVLNMIGILMFICLCPPQLYRLTADDITNAIFKNSLSNDINLRMHIRDALMGRPARGVVFGRMANLVLAVRAASNRGRWRIYSRSIDYCKWNGIVLAANLDAVGTGSRVAGAKFLSVESDAVTDTIWLQFSIDIDTIFRNVRDWAPDNEGYFPSGVINADLKYSYVYAMLRVWREYLTNGSIIPHHTTASASSIQTEVFSTSDVMSFAIFGVGDIRVDGSLTRFIPGVARRELDPTGFVNRYRRFMTLEMFVGCVKWLFSVHNLDTHFVMEVASIILGFRSTTSFESLAPLIPFVRGNGFKGPMRRFVLLFLDLPSNATLCPVGTQALIVGRDMGLLGVDYGVCRTYATTTSIPVSASDLYDHFGRDKVSLLAVGPFMHSRILNRPHISGCVNIRVNTIVLVKAKEITYSAHPTEAACETSVNISQNPLTGDELIASISHVEYYGDALFPTAPVAVHATVEQLPLAPVVIASLNPNFTSRIVTRSTIFSQNFIANRSEVLTVISFVPIRILPLEYRISTIIELNNHH